MADSIELRFRRALAALVQDGSRLVAAVSGGGDSVALLHLLTRTARGRRFEIAIAHLDHGLRRGSGADRRFVEKLAAQASLDVFAERRAVDTLRRRDESPEEAARRVRRAFLLEALDRLDGDRLVTGHTLDDQAETVLMRLARGSGATALCGIRASGPGPFVRPLLGFEGSELRTWLGGKGLEFRDDPTNRSLRFDRNRVRHLVLPVIRETLNPRAAHHLVRAAERLRADAVFLDRLAQEEAERIVRPVGSRVSLDAERLSSVDPVLGRRIARTAMVEAGADARRVTARHIEALLALGATTNPRGIDLPGRLRARRAGRRIWLERRPEG
jgi:tRNA(Ile)-lysidine synthetase-like protein